MWIFVLILVKIKKTLTTEQSQSSVELLGGAVLPKILVFLNKIFYNAQQDLNSILVLPRYLYQKF